MTVAAPRQDGNRQVGENANVGAEEDDVGEVPFAYAWYRSTKASTRAQLERAEEVAHERRVHSTPCGGSLYR